MSDEICQDIELQKTQISTVFENLGMAVDVIRYNPELDRYQVTIAVDGTDETFLRDITEMGTGGAIDQQVNATAVASMHTQIQETTVQSGELNVICTNRDSHYLVEIV